MEGKGTMDPDALGPSSWPEVEPWTPAHQAVEINEYETLSMLLDSGADPDEVCFELTLLTHAIDSEGDSHLQSGPPAHGQHGNPAGLRSRPTPAVCQRGDATADRRLLQPRTGQAAPPALPRTGGSAMEWAWKWSRVFR
ncbi:hypothetical protein GCM10010297_18140 [Streptomyces malachitofuscus]|nr:hypothetical protein GCM10010297_18140 [Streptomyces malachitofuscus]